MFGKLKLGTEVWSIRRGKGKIKMVLKKEKIIVVEFKDGLCDTYEYDGKRHKSEKEQDLFLK